MVGFPGMRNVITMGITSVFTVVVYGSGDSSDNCLT